MKKCAFLLLLLMLSGLNTWAQDSPPTVREWREASLWPTAVVSFFPSENAELQVVGQYREDLEFSAASGYVAPLFLQASYSQGSKHWRFGLGGRLFRFGSSFLRDGFAQVQHLGKVRSLDFSQFLIGEYREEPSMRPRPSRIRFGAALGKVWGEGNKRTKIGLRYELFKELEENQQRTFQETRFTLSAQRTVGERWLLCLFAQHRTNYSFGLAQFAEDKDGNIVQIKPDRNLNFIQPTLGLAVQLRLGEVKTTAPLGEWLGWP